MCSPINNTINSNMSGSYLNLDDFERQTPSPSDSGIAELEAIIKERDSEINFLRDTLEQNEKVIFKVYEEKQHNWKKELGKIRGQYENRLKMCQQRALKMEQLLMNQSHQVILNLCVYLIYLVMPVPHTTLHNLQRFVA